MNKQLAVKMATLVCKCPEDIENEIKKYTLTSSIRLKLLLDKYPLNKMEEFFERLTTMQLDKVYRYGCVSKILNLDALIGKERIKTTGWDYVCENVYELFENEKPEGAPISDLIWEKSKRSGPYSLARLGGLCCPRLEFSWYWKENEFQPDKSEYIQVITRFCDIIYEFKDNRLDNAEWECFCEGVLYDIIVGSLIMIKSMES